MTKLDQQWGSDSHSGSACWQWPLANMNHSRPYNHYSGNNEDDEDEDDEAQHRQKKRQLLLVLWVEIWHRREERIQLWNTHRTYLTHPDLNPSPCIGTPWQHMHARGNDCAFITMMGIDVATFEYILNEGFALGSACDL